MKITFTVVQILVTAVLCCLNSLYTSPDVNINVREHRPCSSSVYLRYLSTNYTDNSAKCFLTNNSRHLRCFGDSYESYFHQESNNWTNWQLIWILTICNSSKTELNPQDIIEKFPNVKKIVIVRGNVSNLVTSFPKEAEQLERIHIVGTRLNYLPDDVFTYLPSLRVADLRNNALRGINFRAFNVSTLQRVYLAGNPWKCDEKIFWILDCNANNSLANRIADRNKLVCSAPHEGRPLVAIIEILTTLTEECKQTRVCNCELTYVVTPRNNRHIDYQRQLMAFVAVNCSNQGLVQMPEFIPANTTTLYLMRNKITDLSPLIHNPVYKNILDLYLDNNNLESITKLEGSYWLERFRVFSLRGNKLSDIPTYALENALLQSVRGVSIYLGNNPWSCDCHFTPGFQELLVRYTKRVKDVEDVRCGRSAENPENIGKSIRDLKRREICWSPSEEESLIYPLDVLNIVLVLSIAFIIGKLAYDYWLFKKTGELPWIVTKIP